MTCSLYAEVDFSILQTKRHTNEEQMLLKKEPLVH